MEQERNKSNNIFSMSILLTNFFVIILLVLVLYQLSIVKSKINEQNHDIPAFEESEEIKTDVYCLKDYNGKIGIYKNEALVYTLDVYIFTLPEADKKLLADGIEVSTKKELLDIIEMYS